MSINLAGPKIGTFVSAGNGDTYGDAERFELRTQQLLIQPNVKQVGINVAPGSPANGDSYVVGSSPSGWTPATTTVTANSVVYWAVDSQDGTSINPTIVTGGWEVYTPKAGWQVFDQTTLAMWRFNGTSWVLANIAQRKITNATANGALVLDASQGNTFYNTLSGNVTSVTINNPTDAQIITLIWNQGGTAFTVSYTGSTFRGATTVGSSTNKSTIQQFQYDLATTSWIGIAQAQANI